jgi:hypothetical protein
MRVRILGPFQLEEGGIKRIVPRDIDETPLDDAESVESAGGVLHRLPVGLAAHDDAHEWALFFRHGATILRGGRRLQAELVL